MDIKSCLSSPMIWIGITLTYILYKRVASCYRFFSDRGIPGPKPVPLIGNVWGIWKVNLPEYTIGLSKKYGNIYGIFEGLTPNLWINDTKILRSIFVKDFNHFMNRRNFDLGDTKILRRLLSIMTGQEWKDVRAAISPTFTSGKIKRYSAQMKECAERLCSRLHSIAENEGKINLKGQLSATTMDIIAKCAFGLKIDNLEDKQNIFMEKAQQTFTSETNTSPLMLLFFLIPDMLIKWVNILLMNNGGFSFFTKFMENLLIERNKGNQKYNDFPEMATESISAYTKVENGKTVPMWTKEEVDEIVAGQGVIFLLAGFDTTANTLTSSCFILARHPEIQEKIYEEVMSKIDHYGDVCHEMLSDLPYLDQFINEILRMYSPVPFVERSCNKDIVCEGIHIPKGTLISVSPYALHYSEEYYTDPYTFNPDRWNAENKAKLDPFAFMPFGAGPRNCVGMRFALEEIKMVLCSLVKDFRFFPVEETPEKLVVENGFSGIVVQKKTIVGVAAR